VSFAASRLLTASGERQLVDVRRHLAGLRDLLVGLPATAADLDALVASIQQLDELFMIVVVGEFNAGKSAFVNALLGHRVFEEGVTPTTARIQLIRYGAAVASGADAAGTPLSNSAFRMSLRASGLPRALSTSNMRWA